MKNVWAGLSDEEMLKQLMLKKGTLGNVSQGALPQQPQAQAVLPQANDLPAPPQQATYTGLGVTPNAGLPTRQSTLLDFADISNLGPVNPNHPIPGAKLGGERTASAGMRNTTLKNTYMDPEQLQALSAMIEKDPGFMAQQAGLDNLSGMAQLKLEHASPDMDLSPLFNLARMSGAKDVGNYVKPKDFSDTADNLLGVQSEIQKRRGDLDKEKRDWITKLKSGTVSQTNEQKLIDKLVNMIGGGNSQAVPADIKTKHMWLEDVRKDEALKGATKAAPALEEAKTMLLRNSPVSASNFRFKLLKALEAGRITNYELQGEQGSQAALDKLEQVATRLKSGVLTPQNRKDYLDLIMDMENGNKAIMQTHLDYHRNNGTETYGFDPDYIEKTLKTQYFTPSVPGPKKYASPPPSMGAPQKVTKKVTAPLGKAAKDMTEAELDAFLKAHNQ